MLKHIILLTCAMSLAWNGFACSRVYVRDATNISDRVAQDSFYTNNNSFSFGARWNPYTGTDDANVRATGYALDY